MTDIRSQYFSRKDDIMQMSLIINSSFKTQFTDDEFKLPTTKILVQSFNQVVSKIELVVQENEQVLLEETQQFKQIESVVMNTYSVISREQQLSFKTSILKMPDYQAFKKEQEMKVEVVYTNESVVTVESDNPYKQYIKPEKRPKKIQMQVSYQP